MSSDLELALGLAVGTAIPAAILTYSTYKALEIRKSLAAPIYRRHALWMGLVCGVLAFNVVPNLAQGPYIVVYNAIGPVVILAWLDASIPVARRSDPFLKSPLKWEKVRLFVWPTVVVTQVLNSYLSVFDNGSTIQGPVFLVSLVAIAPPVITVIVEARRARDPVFRKSLGLVGLFLVGEFVQTLAFILVQGSWLDVSSSDIGYWVNYSWGSWPSAVIIMFACYVLYRAAGSLAPISKLAPALETG